MEFSLSLPVTFALERLAWMYFIFSFDFARDICFELVQLDSLRIFGIYCPKFWLKYMIWTYIDFLFHVAHKITE